MKRDHDQATAVAARPGDPWRAAGAALLLVLTAAGTAQAQGAPEGQASSPPERFVVAFEQRTRVEGYTNPFRLDELGPSRVVAFRTRLQVALPKIVGPLGAMVELQDSRSGWNDKPFVAPARHINELDVLQGHVRVASDRLPGQQVSGGVLLGRFTLDLGRRRLVARNGMRNTTNTFDGASGWLSVGDQVDARLFVTRPVRLSPEKLDRSEGSRLFWGGALGLARWPRVRAEVYALRLDESGDTLTRRRLTTIGARVYRTPSPGALDYEVDGAWQGGSRQGLDHEASFVHLEAGFSFGPARARVAALYDRASGDSDPGDDRSGRFDTLFGARRFEYAPTGIYGPFFRGNITGSGVRVFLAPARPIEILVAHRALWLAEARDAWVGSGLEDATARSGRFLGHHLEARVRWRVRRWLLLEANWAHFFKGSYLDRVPGSPGTPDSDYVTVGFAVGDVVFSR